MHQPGSVHSNGVVHGVSNGDVDPLSNGHDELEEEEEEFRSASAGSEHRRKHSKKMNSYDRDVISLIGQHLRERGLE